MSGKDYVDVQGPVVQPNLASYGQALGLVSRMFCVFRD